MGNTDDENVERSWKENGMEVHLNEHWLTVIRSCHIFVGRQLLDDVARERTSEEYVAVFD